MRSEVSLALRPVSELRALDAAESWQAVSAPIQFDLDPGDARIPEGWVLLKSKLSRSILDGSAALLVETGDGRTSLEVPVSLTGTIFELIKL
ncbi:MAG: hypothetical protein ACREU7_00870, partial [Burkholderiales bacterium]